jgi:hypothetical protein
MALPLYPFVRSIMSIAVDWSAQACPKCRFNISKIDGCNKVGLLVRHRRLLHKFFTLHLELSPQSTLVTVLGVVTDAVFALQHAVLLAVPEDSASARPLCPLPIYHWLWRAPV